jgi:hypothetical protein
MDLRLDSKTGLLDLAWCAQAQKNGLLNLGRPVFATDGDDRYDSNERADEAVPLARDLNYVLQTVRDTYRPLKWASILRTVAVPDWAERWEVSKITGTGSISIASHLQNSDFAQADFSRSSRTGVMYEFANGYRYQSRELVRAARLGINPSVERAQLQRQAAEELLELSAATGKIRLPNGTEHQLFAAGLATLTPSTDLPALVAADATKTGSVTGWTTALSADFGKILDDLHKVTDAVYVNSKERRYADTLVMPLDEFQALNRNRAANFSANVLDTFMTEWARKIGRQPRIEVWDLLKNLGTISSGPRIVAFDSSDLDVACIMMGKPYGVDQVLEVPRGFEAIASMVTGGFRTLDSNGIAYMDLSA